MSAPPIAYPTARSSATLEHFYGIKVPDPFDWLDDVRHPEVGEWLAAQRQLTVEHLARLSSRARVLEALDEDPRPIPDRLPQHRAGAQYTFGRSANGGATLCRGRSDAMEVVVDPAEIADIRALRLQPRATFLSPSGRFAALGLSQAGSDWTELRIFDLERAELLPSRWPETAHLVVEWLPDESGFFYNLTRARLGVPGSRDGVYRHRMGAAAGDDLIFDHQGEGHAALPLLIRRGRLLLIKTLDFVTQRAALFCRDLGDARPARCVLPYAAPFNVIAEWGEEILLESRWDAPGGRILAGNPTLASPRWREVLPEQDATLAVAPHATWSPLAALAGSKLFATYLVDAAHRIRIVDLESGSVRDAAAPGLFTVIELRADGEVVRAAITSFTLPYACYRLALEGPATLEASMKSPRVPAEAQTEQIFCTSDDGTRIPAFLVRGTRTPRTAPTLLYGYGGWGSSLTPSYRPDLIAWLALGGHYVVANIRGGGEYGERWHAAGARLNRHRSVEDFCTVAADLVARRICPPRGIGIRGASHGGLLVATAVQRRPELFAAAVAEIPLLDIVHLDRLAAGKAIAAELGDPQSSSETFEYLLRYSPLQNVRPCAYRPAMMVVPAERDERVPPSQAFKFVAALQRSSAPGQVALLRMIDGEGHGGWPWPVERQLLADELAFLWQYTLSVPHGLAG